MSTELIVAVIAALAGSGLGAGVMQLIKMWMASKSDADKTQEHYQRMLADKDAQHQRAMDETVARSQENDQRWQDMLTRNDERWREAFADEIEKHKREVRRFEKTLEHSDEKLASLEAELHANKQQLASYLASIMKSKVSES